MFDINIHVTVIGVSSFGYNVPRGGPVIYSNVHIPKSERVSANDPGPGNKLEPSYGTLAKGSAAYDWRLPHEMPR
jgi:hypothetical protein